mgnify:FL=1
MTNVTAFAAQIRDRAGKGAARATRREGRVPGVIYGDNQDPVLISLDPIELMKQMNVTGFFARVYEVDVAGEKYRVLARDLQVDPVSEQPIHIDLMRFSAETRVNVEIQVNFENEDKCPGLRMGGVLNVVRFAIELRCRPDNIPETLTADLSGLEIGDSLHISAIELPEDVELTITDRDFTVATIAAPTVMEEETSDEVDDEEVIADTDAAETGQAGEAAENTDEGDSSS